jgi:DNA-binding transcriptional LysR family regulator
MDRFSELNAFCAVAASGGFSAAGRLLGLVPSTVARLVDALEARLGAPLFNRSTRQVTLTEAGAEYFARAQAILASLEEADDLAGSHHSGARGLLRVSAPVAFARLYIAPHLAALQQRHPGLELELVVSDAVSDMVGEAIDVAIRIGAAGSQPGLVARRLAGHRRVVCASPAYLEGAGIPQVPADLLGHECLRFAYAVSSRRPGWRFLRDGETVEVPVRGRLVANSADVLRQAALDGAGIALLADWLVGEDVKEGRLTALLADFEGNPGPMDVGIHAVYQPNRRGSGKVRAFVDFIAERLGET